MKKSLKNDIKSERIYGWHVPKDYLHMYYANFGFFQSYFCENFHFHDIIFRPQNPNTIFFDEKRIKASNTVIFFAINSKKYTSTLDLKIHIT